MSIRGRTGLRSSMAKGQCCSPPAYGAPCAVRRPAASPVLPGVARTRRGRMGMPASRGDPDAAPEERSGSRSGVLFGDALGGKVLLVGGAPRVPDQDPARGDGHV